MSYKSRVMRKHEGFAVADEKDAVHVRSSRIFADTQYTTDVKVNASVHNLWKAFHNLCYA